MVKENVVQNTPEGLVICSHDDFAFSAKDEANFTTKPLLSGQLHAGTPRVVA